MSQRARRSMDGLFEGRTVMNKGEAISKEREEGRAKRERKMEIFGTKMENVDHYS